MKKNILLVTPNSLDQCAFYRSTGPLSEIKHRKDNINILIPPSNSPIHWPTFRADIVFVQRPFSNGHLKIIDTAKRLGKKVWVDFDDDLFTVMSDNPSHYHYADKTIQENIIACTKLANVVTVSTKKLVEIFGAINKNTIMIPNALDDNFFPITNVLHRTKNIFWRGSNTHRHDLMSVKDEMIILANQYPEWGWKFFGCEKGSLWYLEESMPTNFTNYGSLEMLDYFFSLKNLAPSICVVPLVKHRFNECKSNIAFLEASYFGSIALVPEWGDFEQIPSALKYSSVDDFMCKLEYAMNGDFIAQMHNDSVEYIQAHRLLSNVNKTREGIINGL